MSRELWTRIDAYIEEQLLPADPVLEAALAESGKAGLPAIQVSPAQGKFLHLLAAIQGARRILELGTLGGYSTIWLARSLPAGGRVVTLEIDARHAAVARQNFARARVAELVDLRLGPALDTLGELVREGAEPFDFVFIDADKQKIAEYFTLALKLTRPGSVIVVDNVVRQGAVLDAASSDENVLGVRRFNEQVKRTPGVSATTVQTVGSKGHDGFALIRVTGTR